MKKTSAKRRRGRTKRRSKEPLLKTRFLTLTFPLLALLPFLLVNEIPVPLTSQENPVIVTYQALNTSITLYKIYAPRREYSLSLRVGVAIREFGEAGLNTRDVYVDLGAHEIPGDVEILFVNYSSHVALQGNRSYIAYLLVDNTFTGIPVAYIDEKYTRSFDAITVYYPYQLHFVIRVQKCGIRVNVTDSSVRRITVRVVNEDGSEEIIKLDTESAVNEAHLINTCGDSVGVEAYSSPIPLVVIKSARGGRYLIVRESPLIILAWLTLTFTAIFISQFVKLKSRWIFKLKPKCVSAMYMSSLSHIDSGTVVLIVLFAVFFTVALIISSPVLLIVALVALLVCIYFPQYRALVVGFLAILFSLPLYVIISILPLDPTLRVLLQIAAYAALLSMTFYYIVKEYEKIRRVRAIIK